MTDTKITLYDAIREVIIEMSPGDKWTSGEVHILRQMSQGRTLHDVQLSGLGATLSALAVIAKKDGTIKMHWKNGRDATDGLYGIERL